VIVAGSRDIGPEHTLEIWSMIWRYHCDTPITELISGGARGIDTYAAQWAIQHGIPLKTMKADWNQFGKSAGYRRNVEMANEADALLAIWDGESKGTRHMIDIAKKKGLIVTIEEFQYDSKRIDSKA